MHVIIQFFRIPKMYGSKSNACQKLKPGSIADALNARTLTCVIRKVLFDLTLDTNEETGN